MMETMFCEGCFKISMEDQCAGCGNPTHQITPFDLGFEVGSNEVDFPNPYQENTPESFEFDEGVEEGRS